MYEYKARVIRVVDGDTIDCDVDLGFHMTARIRFRLANIDAPEVRGVEKVEGKAATKWLINRLDELDNEVIVQTGKTGKYGRWIGNFYPIPDNLTIGELDSLSDELVKAGHAEYTDYD